MFDRLPGCRFAFGPEIARHEWCHSTSPTLGGIAVANLPPHPQRLAARPVRTLATPMIESADAFPSDHGNLVSFSGMADDCPWGNGFLRSTPTGEFHLHVDWNFTEVHRILPNVHGEFGIQEFLLHRCRCKYSIFQNTLYSSEIFVGEPDENYDIRDVLDRVSSISILVLPESVGWTFGLANGLPFSIGSNSPPITPLDYTKLENPKTHSSRNTHYQLSLLSASYTPDVRKIVEDSSRNRVILKAQFDRPRQIEDLRLLVKSLRVLFFFCRGEASPREVHLSTVSGGDISWMNEKMIRWDYTDDRPSILIDLAEIQQALQVIDKVTEKLAETPHAVEVLFEQISRSVSIRYSLTLLGTAAEHVLTNSGCGPRNVGREFEKYVKKITKDDITSTTLASIGWNTYDKLKHRKLHDKSRITIDETNEGDAYDLCAFFREIIFAIILNESGYPMLAEHIARNVTGEHPSSSRVPPSKYVVLAEKYTNGK